MARTSTKAKPGTAVVNWQEEMERQAQVAADMVDSAGGGGGKFFTLRAGQIAFDDTPMPGNQMAVIVVASRLENAFYETDFDPNTPTPPTCYAFGTNADTMGPPEQVDKLPDTFSRQSDLCADCPQNEWGSADTGRGKACGNRRRLALLPAGVYVPQGKGGGYELEVEDDEGHYAKAEPGFIKVPVTSGKNFDGFVRQVREQFKRPPHGVICRVYSEPDSKSQFKLHFEVIEMVPDHLLPVIMRRHTEIDGAIEFDYQPQEERAAPVKANAKLGRGRAAPAKRGRR